MAQRWLAAIRYSGFSRFVQVSPNTGIHNSITTQNNRMAGHSLQVGCDTLWYIPGFQAVQLCHWTRAAYIWWWAGLPAVHPLPLYFCFSPCESVLQVLPLRDPLDSRRRRYTLCIIPGDFVVRNPCFKHFQWWTGLNSLTGTKKGKTNTNNIICSRSSQMRCVTLQKSYKLYFDSLTTLEKEISIIVLI